MRRLLIIGSVTGLLLCGGAVAAGAWLWNRAPIDTAGKIDFDTPLAVPPLAPSEIDADGRRVFDLTAAAGSHDFGRDRPTPTWGFNGGYLGPTLRAERGEQVLVNVHNQLSEPTSVHWHGMELPARMDGGPHQPVPADGTWSPTWQVDQPAATLWYHPHPHGQTEKHVYRGLAGMFILDDAPSRELALPQEYGVDDFPVIVQDKKFTGDGQLDDRPGFLSSIGLLGDEVAVNGTVGSYLDVTTERVRLRLLNASTARSYQFGFADGREFQVIGSDGGLLPEPRPANRVMLSPADRAEIVVTMAPGEQTVLRSFPPPLGAGPFGHFLGGDDTLDILQLRAAGELAASPPVPERLAEVPAPDLTEVVQTRSFRFSGTNINGEQMDMDRIDVGVTAGTTEVWEVTNQGGQPHNFHMHGVQFQVVAVDGQEPLADLRGWQDTIYLQPDARHEIAVRFDEHTDPDLPYMYHCHLLLHEDSGMMGQFVVLEPGQSPGSPDSTGHNHG
ncbi:MAG: multicopper oxidase domain-containing protein [Micromonosporaceae bacterium]|nr:multicopper oxidase domain-containing protein [Micromonosporaceae bacterium]